MSKIFTILIIDDFRALIMTAEKYLNNSKGKEKIITILNEGLQNKDKTITDLSINVFYDIDITPDIPNTKKYASTEAIKRIQKHQEQPIDLILSDLNMTSEDKTNCNDQENGCDGSDIIREATKFKIPIYMTSNSLADYFRIEGNNCDTLENLRPESYKGYSVIKPFIPYCKYTNVFGILKNGSGKMGVPDIQTIINEYIQYKNNEMDQPISNKITKKPTNEPIHNNTILGFFTNPFGNSNKQVLIDDSQSEIVKQKRFNPVKSMETMETMNSRDSMNSMNSMNSLDSMGYEKHIGGKKNKSKRKKTIKKLKLKRNKTNKKNKK